MNNESYRVLVDIDALLDTRLATLATIDPDLANEVGQSTKYLDRYSDYLSQIDERVNDEIFKDRYIKRNKDVLKYALSTDILQMISLGFRTMLPEVYRGIVPKDVRLCINVYPYRLTPDEMRLIGDTVMFHLPYEVEVDVIYTDLYNLSPLQVSNKYKEWYTYNIEPWLAIHQTSLLQSPMTSVNIILPKLSTSGNDPLAESFDIDVFSARELLFKTYLNLNFLELRFFTYNHGLTEHLSDSGFYTT